MLLDYFDLMDHKYNVIMPFVRVFKKNNFFTKCSMGKPM